MTTPLKPHAQPTFGEVLAEYVNWRQALGKVRPAMADGYDSIRRNWLCTVNRRAGR
jgi:hypothetical protein